MEQQKKKKKGRPRKTYPGKGVYKPSYPAKIIEMAAEMIVNRTYPQLGHFAEKVHVTRQTLRNWRKKYKEFDEACAEVEDMQREMIINGGLHGSFNATFSQFLLEHNLGAKKDTSEEDGNTYNITIEVVDPSEEAHGED